MSEPTTFDLYIDDDKVVVFSEVTPDCDVTVLMNKADETFDIYYRSGAEIKGCTAFDCARYLRMDKNAGKIKVFDGDIKLIEQAGFARLSVLMRNADEWYHDPISLPHEERFDRVVDYVFGGKHHVRKFQVCHNGRHAYAEFTIYGGMATVDFNKLTRLVIASHLYGVRAEIDPCNMQMLKIYLHARETRLGSMSERHPGTFELIEMIVDRARKVVP